MSKSGKAGFISGQKIRVTTDLEESFTSGFGSVRRDGKVLVTYTNDWDDVTKAKEAALNLVQQGADVVFPILDNGQIGALQALQEKKAWGFGIYNDWKETALQSAVLDFSLAITGLLRDAKAGAVEGKVYKIRIGTEAGRLGTFNPAIPAVVVAATTDVVSKLVADSIVP